jgi:type II secretory pathway component PulF
MKKTKIIYWVITIPFLLFMLFSAINPFIDRASGEKLMAMLQYPFSLLIFLSFAKILGIIAILVPGLPRLKEWAYAGFMFDLVGATHAMIAVHLPVSDWIFMLVFILILSLSYIYYHKKKKLGSS